MDFYVPSPSMNNNHLGIDLPALSSFDLDIDRSDQSNSLFYGVNNTFPKQKPEFTSCIEESPILDDKLEDSSFENFIECLADSLGAKSALNNSDSFTNLTLNEMNTDSNISLLEMSNFSDSKPSMPALEFLTNDTFSSQLPEPIVTVVKDNNDIKVSDAILTGREEAKNYSTDPRLNYYRKTAPSMKANFPPRETLPPLIGIATPVKKPEPEIFDNHDTKDLKKDIFELKTNLFNHKNSMEDMKCMNTDATVGYSFIDMPPQTVPSYRSLKRGYENVKTEPESPPSKRTCSDLDDTLWEEAASFVESQWEEEESARPKRSRNDSGGSSYSSDIYSPDNDNRDMDGSDDDDDDYSDIDADISNSSSLDNESLIDTGKKQKQFFWQYNVQAKGPKGTRLKLAVDSPKDPHVLKDFEDPVFDECNTVVAGIRHGGKARKGDGNEITPNPRRLVLIGRQLRRLNKKINACQLGSDVPLSKRNESRKEKNKLASRACRLKKKAQHEAYKIMNHGVEEEHSQLNQVLQEHWPKLRDTVKALLKNGQTHTSSVENSSLAATLNNIISNYLTMNVAKSTVDYVNSAVLKVESGDQKGGLKINKYKT